MARYVEHRWSENAHEGSGLGMDCFNYLCPFRMNESSNPNQCGCVTCQRRETGDYIIVSNHTLSQEELRSICRRKEPNANDNN